MMYAWVGKRSYHRVLTKVGKGIDRVPGGHSDLKGFREILALHGKRKKTEGRLCTKGRGRNAFDRVVFVLLPDV